MMDSNRNTGPWIAPIWLMILIGGLCLAITGLAWASILSTPSDGARMRKAPPSSSQTGIYLQVLSQNSPLQDGDLVTGLDRQSITAWADRLWRPGSWHFPWQRGETILYTILRQGEQLEIPVRLGGQPIRSILYLNWGIVLFTLIFQILAIFVFLQKPRDPAAQAMFIWGLSTSHFYIWSSYLQAVDLISGSGFWIYNGAVSLLWVTSCAAGLHLALTFPAPLPLVKRFPKLVWLLYPLCFAFYVLNQVISWKIISAPLIWIGQWNQVDSRLALLTLILATIAILRQYRVHNQGADRQKIKWVIYGALFSGGTSMALYLLPEALGLHRLNVNIVGLLLLPFPLSIAIAIWRYQLFDINLIIRRTLIYGALTAILALIFFTAVSILQAIFVAISRQQSAISIVISTLAIAALFNPLRIRIQTAIDRRFYRRKYDAQKMLEAFAATIRSETDLESLTTRLQTTIQESMEPQSISIWLKPAKKPDRKTS